MTDEQTALDQVALKMNANPDDATARMAFFDRLSASEVFVLLEQEVTQDRVLPKVFATAEIDLVLAFDREERLSGFAGGAVPYVAVSGRALAGMLAGKPLGVALNLGSAGETVIDAEALAWLDATLAHAPTEVDATPEEISAPVGLPDALLTALDARLAAAEGMAKLAYLVAVSYAGGGRGHMLAIVDPVAGAEPALTRAVADALTFSGLEAGALDVGFFKASDPVCATLARAGLRFDLPDARVSETARAAPPGSDPSRPPKLR